MNDINMKMHSVLKVIKYPLINPSDKWAINKFNPDSLIYMLFELRIKSFEWREVAYDYSLYLNLGAEGIKK